MVGITERRICRGVRSVSAIVLTVRCCRDQTAYPISDISSGAWSPSTGSDLYAMCDEDPHDSDTTNIEGFGNTTCEMQLTSLTEPVSGSFHTLSIVVRTRNPGATITLTMYVIQGTTVIASDSFQVSSTSYVTESYSLTASEISSITDYTDLRVRLTESMILEGIGARVTQCKFAIVCP